MDGYRGGFPNQSHGPFRRRNKIILCFDGTGNKFSGTDADSNILKIYRMLDRNNGFDKHYYQPGIGTYVNTTSLSHTSLTSRINSWYEKAKDSAVGTSFDQHVMGAYKFLMQAYHDDDIFLFGFSRGAYVARFLAEMLDHVGLLSAGNEEMARFAWKAFARWQQRGDNTEEGRKKKQEMFAFLQAFRETFSRPVRRIRFMGLFDTVNSVPRFENAWMQRSKFPYTARSSAKVIRHAVSIDERRAKFRSDLISETKMSKPGQTQHQQHYNMAIKQEEGRKDRIANQSETIQPPMNRFRRPSQAQHQHRTTRQSKPQPDHEGQLAARMNTSNRNRLRSLSPPASLKGGMDGDTASIPSNMSQVSIKPPRPPDDDDDDMDEAAKQDIEELWFPGCHADLGGGWSLSANEESPLSHGPLVWMVREAQRAGLDFDGDMMIKLKCCDDKSSEFSEPYDSGGEPGIPEVRVTGSNSVFGSPKTEHPQPGWAPGIEPEKPKQSEFHRLLHVSATKGRIHDCLQFGGGLGILSVLSWKMMEYMPFRRMDLKPDGSWAAISFPLPMSETRDIPYEAMIHHSAIRRMEADPTYRPGNLIIGGGGRGVRIAPKELGIGEWEVYKNHGDPVGEVVLRKNKGSINSEK